MRRLGLGILAGLLLSGNALAAETFKVSAQVYQQGALVASPVIVLEANKEAQISIGDDFSYTLMVSPQLSDVVALTSTLTVAGVTNHPELLVAYDTEASIEIGAQKMVLVVSRVE